MSRPRGQNGLRHLWQHRALARQISDILRDITEAEPPVSRPLPHAFNRHCACADCMRAYLRAVEKGDAA